MMLDTVFRWASLTKPLVAATALALMERGQLGLDDPVTRFLPDLKPRLPDGSAPPIRIGTCSPILRDWRIPRWHRAILTWRRASRPAWTSRACRWRRTSAGSPLSLCTTGPGRRGAIRWPLMC